MALEYGTFQDQQHGVMRKQEEYVCKLTEGESTTIAMEELNDSIGHKLGENTTQLDKAQDDARISLKEYEETKRQIEEDADHEIWGIKTNYEIKLQTDREINMELRDVNVIMKKKISILQDEIQEHTKEIKKLHFEIKQQTHTIRNLERDTLDLENKIHERDDTIREQEKRNYDLQKKNRELVKFKLVLDYKIIDLKKHIGPRDSDIMKLNNQIQEMESELQISNSQKTELKLNVKQLTNKLKASYKELNQERQKVRDVEADAKRIKLDLHNCVGYIQDPKMLKKSIMALHSKHAQDDIIESAVEEADINKEMYRQREHLQRCVATLSKKLAKKSKIHRAEKVRIMEENVSLIEEINDLRKELKIARSQNCDLVVANRLEKKKFKSAIKADVTSSGVAIATKAGIKSSIANNGEESEKIMNVIEISGLPISDVHCRSRQPCSVRLPPIQQAPSKEQFAKKCDKSLYHGLHTLLS